jgi:hypothetical protein
MRLISSGIISKSHLEVSYETQLYEDLSFLHMLFVWGVNLASLLNERHLDNSLEANGGQNIGTGLIKRDIMNSSKAH